jgi:hypothetical protein
LFCGPDNDLAPLRLRKQQRGLNRGIRIAFFSPDLLQIAHE